MTVAGQLVASGTSTQHIVFTSNQSSPGNGDWDRIYFSGADAGTILNYCDISYGGLTTSGIDISNSGTNVSLLNTTVQNSASYGIYIRNGSSPSIINCSIINNGGIGVYIGGANSASFGTNAAEWNDIYGNGSYGLRNGTLNISAKYIYWGTEACGDVPDQIYDKSDQASLGIVDYFPWLDMGNGLPSFATSWTGAANTLWNDDANWDHNAPCKMIDATIPKEPSNQPNVISNEECNNLTLEGGSELTVFSGSTLKVNGNLMMEANANGTASLLESGGFSVVGSTTDQFYVTADRWHYFSSPMTNQIANVFYDMYLYDYSEATDLWNNIVDENTPLNVGTGYKVWSYSPTPGTKSVNFENGTLNSGTYFLPVTHVGNGWNMVGNPYPSAIDWDNSGWIKSGIDATVYVWDGVQYITWNGTTGDLTDGVIPAMQGFFVKATSATPALAVSNSSRTHGVDPYKSHNVDNLLVLKINGNGFADRTYINFNKDATPGFDSDFDGYKLLGLPEAPQLYSILGDEMLRVNVLPEITSALTIPLGLQVTAPTEYTITASGLESFTNGASVYLEDLKEGVLIDLAKQADYTFMAGPLDDAARFILHFGTVGMEDHPTVVQNSDVQIYSYDNSVYIKNNSGSDISGTVMIYNIMGQEIQNSILHNSPINKIDLYTKPGYYVVKVLANTGAYSEKVFIK